MSGLLGSNMAKMFTELHEVFGVYYQHPISMKGCKSQKLDIRNLDKVSRFLKKTQPEVIVHAAAMTNVDQCQTDREMAYAVNVLGTRNLVNSAREFCQKFIYDI